MVSFVYSLDIIMKYILSNCFISIFQYLYQTILQYDKCREEHELNNKGNEKKLMMKELNKYLTRKRKKQK